MLNIVIPMAGAGSRFALNGYKLPKPLIPIYNTPMIKVVIDNLKPSQECKFIFIIQKTHIQEYDIIAKLRNYVPNCEIVIADGITQGAACTVLLAEELINSEIPLMIANSDQFVDILINNYLDFMESKNLDGLIMTMTANDIKWSYIAINEKKLVTKVVEKEVISNEATVGIYNFKKGSDFVSAAKKMILNNDKTNNEYYVAPVYNYLINDNKNIGYYNIGMEGEGMYGLGTPADLEHFLSLPISKQI